MSDKDAEIEAPQLIDHSQFYFASGHIQRFKNFSLDNPKFYKLIVDREKEFYDGGFPESKFAPIYYGVKGDYLEL